MTKEQLAERFSRLLLEELGNETMSAVNEANSMENLAGSCATHDHCDANMVMYAAMQQLDADAPAPWDFQDEDAKLWNEAWQHARDQFFFHGEWSRWEDEPLT